MYRTAGVDGRHTRASGLLVLPCFEQRHMRAISFGHGTAICRHDLPSTTDDFTASPAILYDATGPRRCR